MGPAMLSWPSWWRYGDPAERDVQAGEWPAPDCEGDATADRPGRLGQAEEDTGPTLASASVRRATERKNSDLFFRFGLHKEQRRSR